MKDAHVLVEEILVATVLVFFRDNNIDQLINAWLKAQKQIAR